MNLWFLTIKVDMILAEIQFNLSPLKVFYFLMNNLKSKHKLTDSNFNQLAILSQIVKLGILDYGTPFIGAIAMGLTILIAILSQKIIWILLSIHLIPFILISVIAFSIWMCIILILFSYYKIRFDQIHSSIKSIVPNGKYYAINKRRENRLINLINEHKLISNEICKLNLIFRRSAALMSIGI